MDDELSVASDYLAKNLAYYRLKRGMQQRSLALFAELPRSTISQLESGNGNPSLAVLLKLSKALHVTIEELIAAPRDAYQLIKYGDLPTERKSSSGATFLRLLPDPLPGFEIDRLELPAKARMGGNPHMAGTKEYFTCVKGKISIQVSGESFVLSEGDVFSFPGDQAHSYANLTDSKSVGVSVVAYALRRTLKDSFTALAGGT